jgi:hypothetical protein
LGFSFQSFPIAEADADHHVRLSQYFLVGQSASEVGGKTYSVYVLGQRKDREADDETWGYHTFK